MRATALVGAIVVLDLLWSVVEGSTGTVAYGAIDEPAHFATCLVALLALFSLAASRPSPAFFVAALIASVAIDVDHIPSYAGWDGLTGTLPRPYSHSLLAVGALLLASWTCGGRARQICLGLAFGVAAHLFRDLATGPGVPLLWPVSGATVTFPYAIYVAALALVALGIATRPGVARGTRFRRRASAPPLPSAYRPGGP